MMDYNCVLAPNTPYPYSQSTQAKRTALADALTAAIADLTPELASLDADVAALDAASRELAACVGVADPPVASGGKGRGGGPLALLRRWV